MTKVKKAARVRAGVWSGLTALTILITGNAGAQTMQVLIDSSLGETNSILTTSRAPLQDGLHPAVRYYPAGPGATTQVVRGHQYVQCFSNASSALLTGKRATFDQNRPFEPRLATTQEMIALPRDAVGLNLVDGNPVLMQAGELLGFNLAEYRWVQLPNEPLSRVMYVGGVDGACYPVDAAITQSPVPPQCDAFASDPVANDIVFRGQFEPEIPGTLRIAVDVTPGYAGASTSYVYTVWAENGPIYDIQLREQFPFFEDGETQPAYRKSMRLAHPWVCSALGEAHCGDDGREQAGLGYLVTNGGRLSKPATINGDPLSDGSCLRIEVQGRAVRNDGFHANMAFSNSLQVSGRYTSWAWDPHEQGVVHRSPDRFVFQRQLFTTPPEPN